MARAIDAEKYMELLKEQYLHNKSMGNSQAARAWQGAMQLLYDMPTLTPPNEPLALDELREMDGEPVWIKRLKGLSVCDTGWAVVDVCPNQIRVWWFGSEVGDEPSEKDYGETWIAYRRPPERQEGK